VFDGTSVISINDTVEQLVCVVERSQNEFNFQQVEFEIYVGHPSADVQEASDSVGLKF
jgi:hypothetical protein